MENNQEEYIKHFKMELTGMMGKAQRTNKNCIFDGITHGEFQALQYIWAVKNEKADNKGIYVSDLAKGLQIASPAASRMLNTLEDRGLICREIDSKNRRNIYVSLTEKGEETRKQSFQNLNELIDRVILEMGKDDICKLMELWKKFSQLIVKEINLIEKKQEEKEQ